MTAFIFERLDRRVENVTPAVSRPRARSVFVRLFEAMVRSRQAEAERLVARLDLHDADRNK